MDRRKFFKNTFVSSLAGTSLIVPKDKPNKKLKRSDTSLVARLYTKQGILILERPMELCQLDRGDTVNINWKITVE